MRLKFNLKTIGFALAALVASATSYLIAADHFDAPAVSGTGSDITDVYAFQRPSTASNMVVVVNVQGFIAPSETAAATFDEEVMIEINIDNSANKDNVEDLVIQATFDNGKVKVYGPSTPVEKGLMSTLLQTTPIEATV